MSSEWLKVMLEEIARKKAESEQARTEAQRRAEEAARPGQSSLPKPPEDAERIDPEA
jgi:hypothetical protein